MGMIPTQNMPAVIGYYLGIASLIPGLGFITALPAIVCGIIGLVIGSQSPEKRATGHSVTAIVLGILGPFIGWCVFSLILGGMGALFQG